jgi:hypothetical protein
MTKVIVAGAIAVAATYAYAQGVGAMPSGRYQVVSTGNQAWKLDTGTGALWHCLVNAQGAQCVQVK